MANMKTSETVIKFDGYPDPSVKLTYRHEIISLACALSMVLRDPTAYAFLLAYACAATQS